MELNAEQIKKALDWLDSLVGNSNDSDMALFAYQLLGILYDTCEELTEENERLQGAVEQYEEERKYHFEMSRKLNADTVRKMQEKLITYFFNCDELKYGGSYVRKIIDQIEKEMLEETK